MSNKPLVSICMIAYNHEPFISQAIEGVLAQKTNFSIELVIGEDNSSDGTKEICLEYQQKYPEILRVLPRAKNLGMMLNFIDALENCSGKYIALCEGDDYWTDPLKLQKQIDFLEANPNFAVCFHRAKVKYEGDDAKFYYTNLNQKEVTTFEDLAADSFILTHTCVFRNNLQTDLPAWFMESPVGDYPLHLLNAQRGKIKFFPEAMGVYRVHQGGIWSSLSVSKMTFEYMRTVELCRKNFAPRGFEQFSKRIIDCQTNLCFLSFENGRYEECQYYYRKCIKAIGLKKNRTFLALTIRYLLSFNPQIASAYQKLLSDLPAV